MAQTLVLLQNGMADVPPLTKIRASPIFTYFFESGLILKTVKSQGELPEMD